MHNSALASRDGSPQAREATETGGSVVSVRGLTKRYGDVVAVDQLSFALERGTITGFLGPNGAGKTTTLRMLLGLAEPTAPPKPYEEDADAPSTTRPQQVFPARRSKHPTAASVIPSRLSDRRGRSDAAAGVDQR